MKKVWITSLVLLLFVAASSLISSCERYEEDPWITFRKPIDRVKGKRRITEFTIDGRDTLSFFTNKWGNFYLDFTHDGHYGDMLIRVRNAETDEEIDHGVWNIYIDDLSISFNNFYSNSMPFVKCTRKEIKIECLRCYFKGAYDENKTFHHLTMILEQIK